MTEPHIIEHDKDEPPRDTSGNTVYWVNAAMLAVFWIGYLWHGDYDWPAVALGCFTGLSVAIFRSLEHRRYRQQNSEVDALAANNGR